jgi:hypothetical protein
MARACLDDKRDPHGVNCRDQHTLLRSAGGLLCSQHSVRPGPKSRRPPWAGLYVVVQQGPRRQRQERSEEFRGKGVEFIAQHGHQVAAQRPRVRKHEHVGDERLHIIQPWRAHVVRFGRRRRG